MSAPARRILQLDGVRACAFLAVYCHHAVSLPLGWMGVDLFFVLSGFLITRNLLELRDTATSGSALRAFFFRRLIRIVPPYYLALTLILVFHPQRDAGWFYGFASNIHDAANQIDDGPLRSMWSIAVEEQFYLLWPWIVLFLPRRHLPTLFITLICAAPVVRMLFEGVGREAVYRLMPCRMDLLAAGALLTMIDARDPDALRSRRSLLLIGAGVAALTFAGCALTIHGFRTNLNQTLFNTVGYSLSTVFFTCLLGYAVALTDGPVKKVLSNRALRFIGQISYMGYLIHLFFYEALMDAHVGRPVAAVLGLAATLGFATLSWYLVERPFLGLRNRVRPVPAAAVTPPGASPPRAA